MKAIILAAGKWTRLQPVTLDIPKAMVEVFGKSLLQHNMEKLIHYVDEFIIVVKYKKEAITEFFWIEFKWIPIRYHEQWENPGTGWALQWLKVSWDCCVLASDTIYKQSDIDLLLKTPWYWALCQEVDSPEKYGIFKINQVQNIIEVIEKPSKFIWNLASLFYLKINSKLIGLCDDLVVSPRWEYELTDAINHFVKQYNVQAVQIKHDFIDITSIEDLKTANTIIKPKLWKTQYLEDIWKYEVHLGIPQTGIQEIVNYSTDESDIQLREWTSDWKKRFITVENLSSWYNDKDRYPFTLISKKWIVAGLWWWRPAQSPKITKVLDEWKNMILKSNSQNTHTSWLRIYPFARWERLATPFLEACTKYYNTLFENIHMCIDIDEQNIPSQKAFEKIWFQKIGFGKNINNSPESWKQRYVYLRTP